MCDDCGMVRLFSVKKAILVSGLSLALCLPIVSTQAKVLDRLEASVNSSLILHSDVQRFRKAIKLRQQIDPLFRGSALAEKGPKVTDSEIVEFLIDEKIILQKFPVSDT